MLHYSEPSFFYEVHFQKIHNYSKRERAFINLRLIHAKICIGNAGKTVQT